VNIAIPIAGEKYHLASIYGEKVEKQIKKGYGA
jgi:hypothetical protein